MSSLTHTRAGISDALITVGAIDLLINNLHSNNDQVPVYHITQSMSTRIKLVY